MAVVTILALVLAALLLFLPVSQALWFLIFARDGIGSAWIFAYSVLVLLVLVVGAAAKRFSLNPPGWSNVGRFFVTAIALAVLGCIIAIAIGASIHLTGTGHGDSVHALLVGAAGIVLLCTGGLLSQTRRALAADPSGRRERRAAGSKG
jgi:hypothetical protein